MKQLFISLTTVLIVSISVFAQPDTLWTRTYGGSSSDYGFCVQQTADEGFVFVGNTQSFGAGGGDVYLVKTNSNSDTLWTRAYGGASTDNGYGIQQTTDGGYIIIGSTMSYGAGGRDFYLIKTNPTGDTLWTRTYGGIGTYDIGYKVQQTLDGGYILSGYTNSFGAGGYDFYLVKTNSIGDTLWTHTYGGTETELGRCARMTSDGGYIFVGYTNSYGAGLNDVYLVKTNSLGDTLWTRTYGGIASDVGNSVQQTDDGGYIIGGQTLSYGAGGNDVYLIKADSTGNSLWENAFGFTGSDVGSSVQQTSDGGYIVAGHAYYAGTTGYDIFAVKTNSVGDWLWTANYGGTETEFGNGVQQTADGGYILIGYTNSYGAGGNDFFVVRLEAEIPPLTITLTPVNPPIQIPPGGGNFQFDLLIENTTDSALTFDAWTLIVFPNGLEYPLLLRPGLTLPAGGILQRELNQNIPSRALPGNYTNVGNVGIYPDSITCTDSFPFVKLAGDGSPANDLGWVVWGWEGEGTLGVTLPEEFTLQQPYPNPFNPSTVLSFELREAGLVKLTVYDITGREVAKLVNGQMPAGAHSVTFNGSDLASGVYMVRLEAGDFQQTQKLLLVK